MATSRGGVRLNADVSVETAKRLRHILVDEEITFADWLRRTIDEYVAKKEAKKRTRKKPKRKS